MSLTDHLRDKASPVREYIYGCAPRLAFAGDRGKEGKEVASAFGFDDVLARELAFPIPEGVENRRSHAAIAGTAFDYRTRMMLGPLDPRESVGGKRRGPPCLVRRSCRERRAAAAPPGRGTLIAIH